MSEDETKPKKPDFVKVQIVRAVDAYHHRGAVIEVPNDSYHKALLKTGLLKKVG